MFRIMALLMSVLMCVSCSETPSSQSKKSVVLVAPLPHQAMDDIQAGFQETVDHSKVNVTFLNAQGDPNLMRTILQQQQQRKTSAVLPIGTSATQMSNLLLKDQLVIGLAADVPVDSKRCLFSVIDDEISRQKQIEFMAQLYPSVKHWVLLHSSDDKVYPEVKEAEEAAKRAGLAMKPILVTSLVELQNTLSQLPTNAEGIFILKDHLLVSAVASLKQFSTQRHMPLVTSDEGSIVAGGDVALGVREKDIGRAGGRVLNLWLEDPKRCMNERVVLDQLTVFVRTSLPLEMQEQAKSVAKVLHHRVEVVGEDR